MSAAQETSQPADSKKDAEPEQSYGFESYPERRGGKKSENWLRIALLGEGREGIDNIRCEKNVVECVKESPLVKLMISALKSAGCDIDIRRNICCEPCEGLVTGGFDTEYNQVVVCQNKARSRGTVQGVLAHELMHMFDYCRAHMDFKNMDHLACTEVGCPMMKLFNSNNNRGDLASGTSGSEGCQNKMAAPMCFHLRVV
ncbi:hypothetical protein HPB52_014977 [Rhipicephalus sanguineus]|uniref:Mitochondrial inner membrane protease ATP23 n=1 Tax=Rhipicephalus sanguineus TaxID=34632 RepID=A0A9D4PNY0_RHISA|nr:hypothetical protein HPB52_014977 [Rhipicephalus sanguineus]